MERQYRDTEIGNEIFHRYLTGIISLAVGLAVGVLYQQCMIEADLAPAHSPGRTSRTRHTVVILSAVFIRFSLPSGIG